jgi:hypothetical protein
MLTASIQARSRHDPADTAELIRKWMPIGGRIAHDDVIAADYCGDDRLAGRLTLIEDESDFKDFGKKMQTVTKSCKHLSRLNDKWVTTPR